VTAAAGVLVEASADASLAQALEASERMARALADGGAASPGGRQFAGARVGANLARERPCRGRHRMSCRPHPLPAGPEPDGSTQSCADDQGSFVRGRAVLAQHKGGERDAGELNRQPGALERDVPDAFPADCDVLTVPERPAAVTRIRDGRGRGDRDGTRCQRPGARPDVQQERAAARDQERERADDAELG
jgi:hypothetical protein